MKRYALLLLLAAGCATAPTKHRAHVFKSAGGGPTYGSVDFLPSAAGVSDPGMVRLANIGGSLQQSTNGAAFTSLGGGGGTLSNQLVVLARAQALLGSQYTAIGGADFYQSGDFVTISVSGSSTVALSGTARSGVLKLSSGATANSPASMAIAPVTASQIDNVKTSKFYVEWRAALATSQDAATSQALTITGLTGSTLFQIGCRGPTGASFFSVFAEDDGGTVRVNTNTSVPLDTAYHTFAVWNDGTNVDFAIDGSIVVTVAVSLLSGGAPARIGANVTNGATAINREVDIDYAFVVTQPN